MTFEDYVKEHLDRINLSHKGLELVRMGWNARGRYGDLPEGGEAVAEVVHTAMGTDIVHRYPFKPLKVGTKLYTHPGASAPEARTARDFYESDDFLLSQDLDACEQQAEGWNKCRAAMLAKRPTPPQRSKGDE